MVLKDLHIFFTVALFTQECSHAVAYDVPAEYKEKGEALMGEQQCINIIQDDRPECKERLMLAIQRTGKQMN